MTPPLILAVAFGSGVMVKAAAETPAAREQARICESKTGAPSLLACRRALEIGLGPRHFVPVRQIVARRLASLEKWDELVAHFREDVALRPDDADARVKLGSTLLFAVFRPDEARDALEEAVRLNPESPLAHALLAAALSASQKTREAATEFGSAERLDPQVFEDRPAMALTRDAALRDEAWP